MMLKPLLALSFLTAVPAIAQNSGAPAAPSPGTQSRTGQWTVAGSQEACMIHSASIRGTTMSVTATPGEEAFLFVIQNQALGALTDGQKYPIAVEFDDKGPWEIEAIAQHELDRDGPGVVFAVRPGRDDGRNFIEEFTSATGMQIGRGGAVLDNIALTDGRAAMTGLATCLGNIWAGGGSGATGQGGPLIEAEEGETPVPL